MKSKLYTSFTILAIMWLVFLANFILPGDFNNFGITPRTTKGLLGIIFAPFLHDGLFHIISNSLPIFFLTFALLVFYEKLALKVWALSAIIGGGMVWLLSWRITTNVVSNHIGASGVIFSLIGFLIASGIFRKSFKALIVGLIVFFVYGGALWGVIPTNPHVSWEGHLFGLIAGIFLAFIYRKDETTYTTDTIQ